MLPAAVLLPKSELQIANDSLYGKMIKERCRKWHTTPQDNINMWREAVSLSKPSTKTNNRGRKKKQAAPSQQDLNARRALGFAQMGQYRKAPQSLVSHGLDYSDGAYVEMVAKHPHGSDEEIPEGDVDTPQIQLSMRQVLDSIHLFKPGSAGGPSGLMSEHLKKAIYCKATKAAADFKASLLSFVNFLARGGLPREVAPFFVGASLFAGLEKNGGR